MILMLILYALCISAILFPIVMLIFFRKYFSLKNVFKIYLFVFIPLFIGWYVCSKPILFPDFKFSQRMAFCPMKYAEFGPDPFSPRTNIRGSFNNYIKGELKGPIQVYSIWQERYWTREADLVACKDNYEKSLKHQRDVRLRTNMDNKAVIGWSSAKTEQAFGKPEKKEKTGELERWIYYPWEDTGPWSVSVYIKNGKIDRIVGD